MQMATKTRRRTRPWTRADLARLPDDGNRYEVLDGELFVTPQAALPHQFIAVQLIVALAPYVNQHALGLVLGPGAVMFGKNELQPDVEVIPGGRPSLGDKWTERPLPMLVVEILSDSTAHRDVGKKRDAYGRIKIPVYWAVDAAERHVLAWTPASSDPTIVTDVLRWQPREDLPPLDIPLESILPSRP